MITLIIVLILVLIAVLIFYNVMGPFMKGSKEIASSGASSIFSFIG